MLGFGVFGGCFGGHGGGRGEPGERGGCGEGGFAECVLGFFAGGFELFEFGDGAVDAFAVEFANDGDCDGH